MKRPPERGFWLLVTRYSLAARSLCDVWPCATFLRQTRPSLGRSGKVSRGAGESRLRRRCPRSRAKSFGPSRTHGRDARATYTIHYPLSTGSVVGDRLPVLGGTFLPSLVQRPATLDLRPLTFDPLPRAWVTSQLRQLIADKSTPTDRRRAARRLLVLGP